MSSGSLSAALAAKAATSTIPIVFTAISDPVTAGLVASLARPGGNVTGSSPFQFELMPKGLELLTELVPQARVIALLVNPDDPRAAGLSGDMQEAALTKGVQLPILKAGTEDEIDAAFMTPRPTTGRCARRQPRSALQQPPQPTRGVGIASYHSGDLSVARSDRFRRPDQLRTEHPAPLSPGRHLRRKDSHGGEAGRSSGAAADNLRVGSQSQDCKRARPYCSAIDPRPRRRGHRVIERASSAVVTAWAYASMIPSFAPCVGASVSPPMSAR